MNMLENDTTLFLVPALGLNVQKLRDEYGFISGYLNDKDCFYQFENSLYLLFCPDNPDTLQQFLEHRKVKSRQLLHEYDYEGGYTVLVFPFPEQFHRELQLFLKGKYSKFSKQYISLLPAVTYKSDAEGNQVPELSIQYLVCNKSPAMKNYWESRFETELDPDNEFWFKPRIKRETLDIDRIKRQFLDELLN